MKQTIMKNIHLLPTDKLSRLVQRRITKEIKTSSLDNPQLWNNVNIYITSDEDPKHGDYVIEDIGGVVYGPIDRESVVENPKKIILTTDQDLIKDGVQGIDDEFLEWFVKNPSCEFVEVEEVYPLICCIQKEGKTKMNNGCMERNRCLNYKIIIPREEPKCTCKEHDPYCCLVHGICPTCVKKEEPKQETLEEIRNQEISEDYYPPKDLVNAIWGCCFQYEDIENNNIREKVKNACFMIEKIYKIQELCKK